MRRGRVGAVVSVLALGGGTAACGGEDDPRADGSGGTGPEPTTTADSDGDGFDEADDDDDNDDDDDDDDDTACVPGMQVDCSCPDGSDGVQVCADDGASFEPCECVGDDESGEESTGEEMTCGNGVCDEDLDEDCSTCEEDCGVCEPCAEAPSCEGAEIPPVITENAAFLNDPMAYVPPPQIMSELAAQIEQGTVAARLLAAALSDPQVGEPAFVTTLRDLLDSRPDATDAIRRQLALAGMEQPQVYIAERNLPSQPELVAFAATHQAALPGQLVASSDPTAAPCDDPRMRIRVARLIVHEEDDDFLNDEIYCAITTEAPMHAELKVTPMTTALDEGDSVDFNLDAGLIWGQSELTAPMGNILITYNCIESDTDDGYANLLGAIGDAVGDFDGEEVGVDGWVFPAAGQVTNLLAGALTLDGDDLLFNGSQTIQDTDLLGLVYGAWWSVRRDGTNITSDWDWELRMEIWGCHDYGTGEAPPPPG